ncbi:uncharacterized protein si:dkey-87o1.2 isoform X2 [Siniperca chuatsi]|uniref:uncharacterized protein si:dkey-87o1.2 isoform X2 n=1 Tax=Siniperca chuatsi TaxID=119488 RepID=UPI001CE0294E|nr:uncharacterized protein si:dkey-87o1.2 isoform X2 [Siniperca chuatsi]
MKLAIVLLGLSVVVMAIMVFQAVRQELNLRNLKTRIVENSAEVKTKEEAIVEAKNKIQELKTKLASVNTKANVEKKKTDMLEAIIKLKADHDDVKKKAGGDIQNLKQQILDRDKAICAFADTTKEEARKLCGISEAPK